MKINNVVFISDGFLTRAIFNGYYKPTNYMSALVECIDMIGLFF